MIKTKEEQIMNKVKIENGFFSVGNDESKTHQLKEDIVNNQDNQNNEIYALYNSLIRNSNNQVNIQMKTDLDIMRENKQITNCLPSDTKLKKIKDILVKLSKVTTRYQEQFNEAVYNSFNKLDNKLKGFGFQIFSASNELLKEELKQRDEKIELLEKRINELEKEINK